MPAAAEARNCSPAAVRSARGPIYAQSGLDLDRSTPAGWVGKAAFHLRPVADRLARHLKRSSKLFMDETRAPVLDPGRGRTRTGWLWALARDDRPWAGADSPGVMYFCAPGRGGEHAEQFLEGFDGILQVDGYAGYNRLDNSLPAGHFCIELLPMAASASSPRGDIVVSAPCAAHRGRGVEKSRMRFDDPLAFIAAATVGPEQTTIHRDTRKIGEIRRAVAIRREIEAENPPRLCDRDTR